VALVLAQIPAAPVLALMAFGVVLAMFGHIGKNYKVVGIGLAALFLATGLMIVLGFASYQDNSRDPRPCAIKPAC
jgi:hypothetical protein